MNQDVVLALTVPGMFGWFAWLIFNTIRRYKIAKLQAEVQTKLLEKVSSGQELLAYAQTETGRELLESLKVERIAPHGRIISGSCSIAARPAWPLFSLISHRCPLHAMSIGGVLPIGNRATMSVPLPLLPDLISRVPPSCRILSRIPLIPTPTMPVDAIADRFFCGMPLPLSSISKRTSVPMREM